jgi:hypothetical protein
MGVQKSFTLLQGDFLLICQYVFAKDAEQVLMKVKGEVALIFVFNTAC